MIVRKASALRKLLALLVLVAALGYGLSFVAIFHSFYEPNTNPMNEDAKTFVINPLHDPWIEEEKKINASYYYLTNNSYYYFEFRYELNPNVEVNGHRLMIFTVGRGRTCIDYWRFPVGRRIVYALRKAGYSLLAICSKKRLYETEVFAPFNEDVKWIYKCLQRWMNRVYFPRFQRYPLLYIHGTSRGSAFAPSLARYLPIQALILTIYPGNRNASTTRSLFSREMQNRLILDSNFANWFYFDYCYNTAYRGKTDITLCPFETKLPYFYPVPPTYFVALDSDPNNPLTRYKKMIKLIQQDSLELGGKLLNHTDAIMMDILSPMNVTETYMQEHYDLWYNKPHSSRLFFEHFHNRTVQVTNDSGANTCRCSNVSFTYWESFPNVTSAWSLQKQAELKDYLSDVKQFKNMFCEELCGDIMVHHATISRNFGKTLDWLTKIDYLRQQVHIEEYLSRPLRVWTYRKQSILNGIQNFSNYNADWTSVEKQYQMYAVEYLLQDYFIRLNKSSDVTRSTIVWTDDPLLADYFIVPHDLMYLYFRNNPKILSRGSHEELRSTLNKVYFERFMINLQKRFPFWTMAENAQMMGSNHIFTFVGPKNMAFLHARYRRLLKNVIQLVFTGTRSELPPVGVSSLDQLQNATVTYRDGYDIVLPPYVSLVNKTRLIFSASFRSMEKKYVFFFRGVLNGSTIPSDVRVLLARLSRNRPTKIQNRMYQTLLTINENTKATEYIKSMSSSLFVIVPKGSESWHRHIYEAIQLGVVPIVITDNIILPFERFIDCRSFIIKTNVSQMQSLLARHNYTMTGFESYIEQNFKQASFNLHAFRWPYAAVRTGQYSKQVFKLDNSLNSTVSSVFYYIASEMRCRRLEQLYGLEADVTSKRSKRAQAHACFNHPVICPCPHRRFSLAFDQHA